MLDALRFVQGAVAKKDYVPALKHFRIENGRVTSYNGVIALSAPIDLNLNVTPRADQFAKAIATCDNEISLTVTPTGRIGVRGGGFRAFVDCTDLPFPMVMPEGLEIQLKNPLLYALNDVWPFISDDASRAWSQGVLFSGNSIFATNNVILIERWLGADFPFEVNVPRDAIAEMLRIGEEPYSVMLKENALTLLYRGGRWLRTQLLTTEWPGARLILDRAHDGDADARMQPVPEGFFLALEKLSAFLGEANRIYLGGGALHTSLGVDDGASVDVPVRGQNIFNYKMLRSLEGAVTRWDLDGEGKHCPFIGTMLRGVMIGMR
jgi:hypothetical protein